MPAATSVRIFQYAVEYGDRTDDATFPTTLSLLQAEQADHVRPVGVEGLSSPGFIQPYGGIIGVLPGVANMSQQISGRVLCSQRTHMQAQPEVSVF